jgi:hypothetical protein
LSAEQTPESQQIQSNRQVKKSSRSGQFLKDFSATNLSSSFFLLWLVTTEAMGTGGLRAYSLSHSDKVNAGAKPAKCTSASL